MNLKLITVGLLFIGLCGIGNAQNFSGFQDTVMNLPEDYAHQEVNALKCSSYVLSVPIDRFNLNRLYAMKFLIRWMDGTRNHTFLIDEQMADMTNNDQDLLGLYLACLAKVELESTTNELNVKLLKYNAVERLLMYVQVPGNNVVINRKLQRMIRAQQKGKLKKFLHVN